jgi:hypothetical protein
VFFDVNCMTRMNAHDAPVTQRAEGTTASVAIQWISIHNLTVIQQADVF